MTQIILLVMRFETTFAEIDVVVTYPVWHNQSKELQLQYFEEDLLKASIQSSGSIRLSLAGVKAD